MLERDDIQGFLLQPQFMYLGRCFFLRVTEQEHGRAWLRALLPHVTSATPRATRHTSYTNICFTYGGLAALGTPADSLASFDDEFREGMVARAKVLGDTGPSSPEHWTNGLAAPDLHALLILFASDRGELEERSATYRAIMAATGGIEELSLQDCQGFPGSVEHFGYRDAISDLIVEGSGEHPDPNKGRPLAAGEFFLGYPDETGETPPFPQPEILGRNGSYVVYRKLYEDVAAFRAFLSENSDDQAEAEWLAAKMLGRWRSGAPLVLAPTKDDPALGEDFTRNNVFNYARMDPQGLACPRGAHIRRVNPRDSVHGVNRNRLIRRGLPYGPRLPEGAADDGADRGIAIFFGNASIGRQFEFVQRVWINNRKFNGLENEKDPLAGDNDGTTDFTIQRKPFRRRIAGIPRFTSVRGGGYFFMPGMRALQFLAGEIAG